MIRYFNAHHKALKAGKTGPFSLECQDGTNQWNESGGANNIIWDGDVPRFRTEAEEVDTRKPDKWNQLVGAVTSYILSKYSGTEQAGLLAFISYGNSNQKSACKDIWDWVLDEVQKADFLSRKAAVESATTLAELDAISLDFSNNDANKPPYTYIDIVIMT